MFETAGPVQNFLKALARIPGFEFMGDYEAEFEADGHYAVIDQRKGREGQDRTEEPIASRLLPYDAEPYSIAANIEFMGSLAQG